MLRPALAGLCALFCVASEAMAFEGRYASRGAVNRTAAIKRMPDGRYSVKIEMHTRGCIGDVEAIGRVVGRNLIAAVEDDDCRLTISQSGTAISVRESKCLMWHGASCEFDGTLARR